MLLCNNNYLTNLNLRLDPEKLTCLFINDNNFTIQDLTIFSEFVNLEALSIGSSSSLSIPQNWNAENGIKHEDPNYSFICEKIVRGMYNRVYGSLESLKNLTKLEYLNISNTDINEGLEYLPNGIKDFFYSSDLRPESKVKDLVAKKEEIDRLLLFNQVEDAQNKELERYENFSEFEKIGIGGFGTVYKVKWNDKLRPVAALKVLDKIKIDQKALFQEFANHRTFLSFPNILRYYVITKNSTGNYAIASEYCEHGTIRDWLTKSKEIDLFDKCLNLFSIIEGLDSIHDRGLVHKDFHPGNILIADSNMLKVKVLISDLGLSRLLIEGQQDDKIFGVLPYIAPEVLKGEKYTRAADIYSLGTIMYEVLTGFKPFYNEIWDNDLGLRIINGLRLQFPVKMIPQLEKIIQSCWSTEPEQRPTARKLWEIFEELLKDEEFKKFLSSPEYNHPYQITLQCHLSVCWISKWCKIVNKIQNLSISSENTTNSENKKEIQVLEEKLNSLKKTLVEDQQHFFVEFVNLRKEFAKDKKNKKVREKIKSLNELIKDIFSKEIINEIIENCDKIVRLENEEIKEETYEVIEQSTK